jgi:hypothetical protein
LAILPVDQLFEKRRANALHRAPYGLSMDEERIDAAPDIFDHHIAQHLDLARLRVYSDMRDVGAVAISQLVRFEVRRGFKPWLFDTVGARRPCQAHQVVQSHPRNLCRVPAVDLPIPELQVRGVNVQITASDQQYLVAELLARQMDGVARHHRTPAREGPDAER